MQRPIFSLLFPIAGVLLFQSVQAQTLVDANGEPKPGPSPGIYNLDLPNSISALVATNLGTITGQPGKLELRVTGDHEFNILYANGENSPGGSTRISMTTGQTVIFITPRGPSGFIARAVTANLGGMVTLNDAIITELPFASAGRTRALDSDNVGNLDGIPSTLIATNTAINMSSGNEIGAFAFNAGRLSLTGDTLTYTDSTAAQATGWVITAQRGSPGNPGFSPLPAILTATDTTIIVGDSKEPVSNKEIVSSWDGGSTSAGGATCILNHCTVTSFGTDNTPLLAWWGRLMSTTIRQ